MFNIMWNTSLILMNWNQFLRKTILEIKFLRDFSIVTFDIRIFYICGKSLYQNFDLNSLYYIIIFIVFISQRKGKFSYINFTSNAQHNFKCNIFVCKTIFQCKYFFNANNFFNKIKVSMKNVFQCKWFFDINNFSIK